MKTGSVLVELLQTYGVDVVFGIPGTHSVELYRALAGSSIQHVLPRHEQGAGFMADGYARVSGKPGVCFVITGPGVTNIATPMAQAMSDSVPMLVISPVNDIVPAGDGQARGVQAGISAVNLGRLHELDDQAAVTRPFTLFSETVASADEIPELLGRAFSVFHTGRAGPVHINIPLSILRGTVDRPWQTVPLASPPMLEQAAIDALAAEMQSARSPLIVAGGGCRHFGELVVSLAEKLACPLVTTVAGRGIVPASHPLCAGAQTSAPEVQRFIAAADLLLVLGSELAEPDHWTEQLALPERQIWVNIDSGLVLRQRAVRQVARHGVGVAESSSISTLHADARLLVPAVIKSLEQASPEARQQAFARCRQMRDSLRSGFSAVQQLHWRVLTELKKALPSNACVFSDMTQLAYTAVDYLPWHQTNSWMHPNGFGTLGYALPAATGACFSGSGSPMLVIVGDAGLQYTIAEMALAAEHQFNIVVLLWQNNALQQISDDMHEAGFTPLATTQPNPDFVELALVYGWSASKLAGVFELATALETAFAADGPVLLELDQTQG